MTRIVKNNRLVPVTVLQFLDQTPLETNDSVIKLFIKGEGRSLKHPQLTILDKKGIKSVKKGLFREISKGDYEGGPITIDAVEEGIKVSTTAWSKGKGWCGVMKRWNFKGGNNSHGASRSHRQIGSTGCIDMTRTYKGRKMPGRMGNEKVCQNGLTVVEIDRELNCVLVSGSVPGPKNSIVLLKRGR